MKSETIREKKERFEREHAPRTGTVLTFHGTEGYDVYNCSVPFEKDGETYIFGRVERREEWASSHARLFRRTGEDEYAVVPESMIYPLEDPFVSVIQGEIVLGGTHVRKRCGRIDTYYGYFYRGTDLMNLTYFTTGPDYMKDIRLVELADGRIGVFSRPRNPEIEKKYGSASMIGYTEIDTLDELTDDVILNAEPIPGIFAAGEWGGCNQPILLPDGKIGIVGHQSYTERRGESSLAVYLNTAFTFDPATFSVSPVRIIGTRGSYPELPAKKPELIDCAFTSGIVLRPDGKADLYSGIGDVGEGRTVIDYPFEEI